MRKRKKQKNKGITLIALVITIIVLLILAGISIATLTGENGILTRANEARTQTEEAEEDELRKLTQAEAATHLEEYEYEDPSGEEVTIPAKCAVSQVEGENTLENGLVIIDANGNEWVWIEIPKSEMPEGLTFDNNADYTTLETALQTYAADYRGGYVDEWYEGCGLEEAEYTTYKKGMLKSIYENGGFYIGRYEVGSFDNPVTAEDTTRKAVVQKGVYPYNYVTCSQAQEISEQLTIGEKTSSLMFGIQWDLVLKFIETKNQKNYSELRVDSSTWGNYGYSTFQLDRNSKYSILSKSYEIGNWNTVTNSYVKQNSGTENWVILSTGAAKRNSVLNIYDLAGNMAEWTLEQGTLGDPICVNRGGFLDSDSIRYVSGRASDDITGSRCNIGFRTTLYL